MFPRLAALSLLLYVARACPPLFGAAGDDDAAPVEPPVVHRPSNFSGAVGSYRVTMRAEPTTLQAEDPIRLTLTITGTGAFDQLERPDLRKLAEFNKSFAIANGGDRLLSERRGREFDYVLRPRSTQVKQVPPFPFVYFKPGAVPDYLGYETTYARAIPLTVRPRAAVAPNEVGGAAAPRTIPESFYALVEGDMILRRDEPLNLPGPFVLVAGLLLPPALAVLWYLAWRRRHPDVVRVRQLRRSRAAQQALKAVSGLKRFPEVERAGRAEAILTEYLRQRLEFTSSQPTPPEVRSHLQGAGIPRDVGEAVTDFLGSCEAARFAPPFAHGPDWPAAVEQLLLNLETQAWPTPAC